ncbi:replication-relaxation family protein [Terasakiella sp.]|uniref:replication-relaxation family protein n=1 Tax=Terasakiella sp. TaxID=2034861 RepID=UPI003AA8026A
MATCLSHRDLAILFQLQEKVSLTVSQIHKLCFQGLGRDSAYKGIAKLKRRDFIKSCPYDFGRFGKLEDMIFLTKPGFGRLESARLIEGEYRYKAPPSLIVDYAHRVGIIDYWIALEQDAISHPDFELAVFYPEFKKLPCGKGITLKADLPNGETLQIRNDALFILRNRHTGLEHLFLLEIDQGTMPIITGSKIKIANSQNMKIRSNLTTKIEKIQNIFDHWELAIQNLGARFSHFQGAKVVVITDTAKRTLNMLQKLSIRACYASKGVFLFSHMTETQKGALTCRYAVPHSTGAYQTQKLIDEQYHVIHLHCLWQIELALQLP